MATDQYDAPSQQPQDEKRGGSGCLKGCLIAIVILLVLVALAAYLITKNWRNWAAAGITQTAQQAINESGLPEEERAEVMEQVNRVADAVRDKQISFEQFVQTMEQLAESPLMSSIDVTVVEEKHLASSGLSEEEKVEARTTLHRFASGVVSDQIGQQEMDEVMTHVADRAPDGSWQVRDQVTDEQLRAFLAAAKAKADEAGVPEEVEEIDWSEETRKVVDEALSGTGAAPADMEQPVEEDAEVEVEDEAVAPPVGTP